LLSVVTNASANDAERLDLVVPHWIAVLGARLAELTIVVDTAEPSGRIATLHARDNDEPHAAKLERVCGVIAELSRRDRRVAMAALPEGCARSRVIGKWFGGKNLKIDRCQAGTPILPFVAAFEAATHPVVLRADCDMLFHDNGWIDAGADLLLAGSVDLLEPPRCGPLPGSVEVSTRALMLRSDAWTRTVLPIEPTRLDPLRRLHRRLHGRPTWLALEQMLEASRRAGRIRYTMLEPHLGCTLHIARRADAALPMMPAVCAAMEAGRIPKEQFAHGHDFCPEAWGMAGLDE
jgi:hypothetical protein